MTKRKYQIQRRKCVGANEHQEQVALFQWAEFQCARWPELALLYAIPNGGKRDIVTGALLKAEGVKPGVLDVCLPVARGGYHGLYVEMKTLIGKPSKAQRWWIDQLTTQGYYTAVCKGCQPAMHVISSYLSGSTDVLAELRSEPRPIIRQHWKPQPTRVHQSRQCT